MSDARTLTLDSTPNRTVLFARAAATSIGRGGPLQDVQVRHPRTWIHLPQLAAYDKVCGFALRDALPATYLHVLCLLYTSDAADDLLCVDLGGRRIIKKKKT